SVKGGPLTEIMHKPQVQTSYSFITPDSRYIYFRANDKKPESYALYRYDRKSKKIEDVFSADGIWSIEDHKPNKLLLAKEVGSNMTEFYEYDESTRALTPLFGQGEREDYNASYGAGDEILVLTPHFGEFRRLYSWVKGKWAPLSPEIKFDVSGFRIDEPRTRILYAVNENGYEKIAGLEAKSHKPLKMPPLPKAENTSVGNTTHDGRFTIFSIDNGVEPLQHYAVEWKTMKLTRWTKSSAPEIDLSGFQPTTLETYPARDGTPIPVLVHQPKSCNPAPCAVIVDFHGGPESQATPGFSPYAQLFLDAGFVYVEPNVRGSDGYGKTWLHSDDAAKRLDVITDIEDAATWAKKRFAANGVTPKVGITGGSYGGYATLVGMTMFAGAYDAGAEVVGISNLITFLNNTAPYRRPLRISEYGDPEKDKDALVKLSPITYIDKVKAPLLMIQGASDPRVPVGEALQFYEAMSARKLPVELVVFGDEGHGAQKRGNIVAQIGYPIRFFQKYLQGKEQ
ncbi:MAG: S9 family peptidase, partial [Deltaproteobacteria bacterium]|nr:S9 family peptidase [Deltaproteobacteria bacterium]